MRWTWSALVVVVIASITSGCGTVCDEVVDEAEANGCTVAPPSDDDTLAEQECEGDLEKRANCLLDLTDNLCALSEAEENAVADCYAAEGVD